MSIKIVLIDFHTHTTASDGALTPIEMIDRAVANSLQLIAITDHDTVAGYKAAAEYYTHISSAMRLVPGIEFSCCWSGTTIHIVGLGMDVDHPAMVEGVKVLQQARSDRSEVIGQRLEKLGFTGALAGARDKAGARQVGRPDFAAWMVECGHVQDANEAFTKFLGQGKTGDVKAYWPDLAQVVDWVSEAGGVAIIAHPLKYRFTRMKLRRLVVDFKSAGGRAVEIISGRQTKDQTAQLQRLAEEFELEVSLGSDFHRDSSYGAELGVELPALNTGTEGVWQRWSEG